MGVESSMSQRVLGVWSEYQATLNNNCVKDWSLFNIY